MPKVIGQALQVRRVLTGWDSFDRAFNIDRECIGVPVGTGIEFYGQTHTGKSTFVYSLAGKLSVQDEKKRGVVLCDLEGFDPRFAEGVLSAQGMTDEQVLRICDGTTYKKTDLSNATDEQLLGELVDYLATGEFAVGVHDSIGAISPISEREGEFGEANMGRRAFIMAQVTRAVTSRVLRQENAPTFIATNHYYPVMAQKNWDTPGGQVKNYMLTVRIRLQQLKANRYEDGSYLLKGIVDKNRYGGGRDENEFEVFIQSGHGVHDGLTAVNDCVNAGIAEKTTVIKLNGKSYGYFSQLRERHDDPELFIPFLKELEKER